MKLQARWAAFFVVATIATFMLGSCDDQQNNLSNTWSKTEFENCTLVADNGSHFNIWRCEVPGAICYVSEWREVSIDCFERLP